MAVNYRRIAIVLAALLLSLGGLALSASLAQAAPAAPIDIPMTQPDGSVITVRQWGDEWQSGYETKDGHTILKDSASGFWVYAARQGNGSLAPALTAGQKILVVGRDNPGSLAQHLRPDATPLQKQQRSSALPGSLSGPSLTPNLGTQKVLLLLVEFSDRSHTYPESTFRDLVFGSGDSVKSFYKQASYGKLNLQPAEESFGTANDGVIGWIQLSSPAPQGTNINGKGTAMAPKIVNDALVKAKDNINYASFDTNKDGYISNTELHIIVLVSVFEYSYGGDIVPAQRMWAHRWSLDDLGSAYSSNLDGVSLGLDSHGGGYAMFGEIHWDHPATMGVIAHELGHDLSWPDLYDISQGSQGVGDWSIMGGGSWNGISLDGDKPALPDAWLKYYQGWLTPKVMVSGSSYDIADAATNASVFLMGNNPGGVDWNFFKKSGTGEYFLVENRQWKGFDAALPGCGILIWHINETTSSLNDANAPDYSGTPPLVALEQADGLNDLSDPFFDNLGDAGDPFPGDTSNKIFGETTNPNSLQYNGIYKGERLTIINDTCSDIMNVKFQNMIIKIFLPIAQ